MEILPFCIKILYLLNMRVAIELICLGTSTIYILVLVSRIEISEVRVSQK